MHEPLIALVFFVDNYQGPWMVKGTPVATQVMERLAKGFRIWESS
jgi:hypothetical protein